MIREILKYPDPVLSEIAVEITPGKVANELLQDLVDTCVSNNGLGLAAPQIGQSVRAIVVRMNDNSMLGIINPRIVERSGVKIKSVEGCLSFDRELTVTRKRHYSVRVVGDNNVDLVFKDRESRIVQHEIDHLNGITIAT